MSLMSDALLTADFRMTQNLLSNDNEVMTCVHKLGADFFWKTSTATWNWNDL